jgi:hypothetical protein
MRIYLAPLIAFSFLTVACTQATKQSEATSKKSEAYEDELEKAFAEMAANEPRGLALRRPAQAVAGIDLKQLNEVKPGKFKVYVFPKMKSQSLKSIEDDKPLFKSEADEAQSRLGPPLEYEVSTLAENPCFQFIERGLFAKLGPKNYFDPQLAKNQVRRCAIVEITSIRISKADRMLVKRDDMIRTVLFLDDAYVLHGYEIEKFVSSRETQIVRVKTPDAPVSTSGLTLFPVDIPTLDVLTRPEARTSQLAISKKIDKLGVAQIRKRHMRSFSLQDCKGVQSAYVDYFGSQVEVGWCEGLPFPQYMENSRFLAITQPLSVR